MAGLPYKPRWSPIVSAKSIAAGGETVNADLPTDYTVTGLIITEKHVQDTNEASLAEKLASLNQFELVTRNGGPWKISGTDLFYLNRDMLGKEPHISQNSVATDNYIIYKSLYVPFNPMGLMNTKMGVMPNVKAQARFTMGTDAASGSDDRVLYVRAVGFENLRCADYMGCFVDSFTSTTSDNFRDIQQDKTAGLMGAFHFQTTGVEDLTTSDAPGLKNIGWAVAKSVRESMNAHAAQLLNQAWNTNARAEAVGLPVSDYTLLDTGLRQGDYIPYVSNLQVYLDTGVAEAARCHPLLAVRNE